MFIEELSIPCVIQGWRLIYLRDVLTFFFFLEWLYVMCFLLSCLGRMIQCMPVGSHGYNGWLMMFAL